MVKHALESATAATRTVNAGPDEQSQLIDTETSGPTVYYWVSVLRSLAVLPFVSVLLLCAVAVYGFLTPMANVAQALVIPSLVVVGIFMLLALFARAVIRWMNASKRMHEILAARAEVVQPLSLALHDY